MEEEEEEGETEVENCLQTASLDGERGCRIEADGEVDECDWIGTTFIGVTPHKSGQNNAKSLRSNGTTSLYIAIIECV